MALDAGGTEIGQKLHDTLYWQEVDNLPDEWVMLMVCVRAAHVLKAFPVSDEALVVELGKLANAHVLFWKWLHTDLTPSLSPAVKLREYARLRRESLWHACDAQKFVELQTDPYHHLQTFVDRAAES